MAALLHTRLTPALLLVGALAGCGDGTDDKFAPACPSIAILRDGADLARFRGTGRDLTDAVLTGRITTAGGSCKRDGADTVVASVQVGIELMRGPASPGRQAQLAYFVAVLDGERVLDEQVFRLNAEFPANADRLRLTGDEVELRLPVRPNKTAAAYRILVSFKLSPVELEVNRRRGG